MTETFVRKRSWRDAALVTLGLLATTSIAGPARAQTPWRFGGSDIGDTHAIASYPGPVQISPAQAPRLALNWTFKAQGDITMTPTASPDGVYFTDSAGQLYKLDPATGALGWKIPLNLYAPGAFARASPAIGDDGDLVFGIGSNTGAHVVAINRITGHFLWIHDADPHPTAHMHASPVIYNGRVYFGVAYGDEGPPPVVNPTSRGIVAALNEATGQQVWKFYTVPGPPSGYNSAAPVPVYSGAGVLDNTMAIDPTTNLIFVGTGDNYSIPTAAATCVAAAGGSIPQQLACLDPTDYVDSILGLDLDTGVPKWARRVQGADVWTFACLAGAPASLTGNQTCQLPNNANDYDFSSGPTLVPAANVKGLVDNLGAVSTRNALLGIGGKSGVYIALNPATGGMFWGNTPAPGPILWGTTTDIVNYNQVFVPSGNDNNKPFYFGGNWTPWNGGTIASLDMVTGAIRWQVKALGMALAKPAAPASADGALSFSNGVVFGGFTSGIMAAFNAANGATLWQYQAAGNVVDAPAIFNDTLYWGCQGNGGGGGTLYSFSVHP
jgi:polyvinyl alcohol dehydrogenase (cytochrome)